MSGSTAVRALECDRLNYSGKGAAKINLAIDVLRKRPDGYHDVCMIMQSVALYDTINVRTSRDGIKVVTNSAQIPSDSSNIVYKAAEYLKIKYNVKKGAIITIDKVIPVAAGLAGGSADAAATIKLLDKLWDLRLSKSEMLDAGRKLGSDVPFCLQGGTALAEGLGDKLTQLKSLPQCFILLAKPSMAVSTQEVYQGLKLEEITERPNIRAMMDAIDAGNVGQVAGNMCNVLETVTTKKCPQIGELKDKLLEYGALGSMMSGSGPTVFGMFGDRGAAYDAYDHVKSMVDEVYVVKTTEQDW